MRTLTKPVTQEALSYIAFDVFVWSDLAMAFGVCGLSRYGKDTRRLRGRMDLAWSTELHGYFGRDLAIGPEPNPLCSSISVYRLALRELSRPLLKQELS